MSATDGDLYEGSLHREAERGAAKTTFKVPGDRPDEIAVLPQHLPFGKYRGKNGEKDVADEKRLCGYDFHKAGSADSGVVALLPKRSSTSAAVEIFELPAGATKPEKQTASFCASVEKGGKCLAKFKQTDNEFTTTSTAAILGYYHVSRVLGDICEIKPAVLRTVDIEQHKQIVRLATEMGVRGTIAKSWGLFNKYYASPKSSDVARTLFTSDFTQIYGALLENTTGEEGYAEWLKAGSDLSSTRAFSRMADWRSAQAILGSKEFTQSNVQALVAMRDMSEIILLDYLLGQSDRLTGGNISNYQFAYYVDGGDVKSVKASKASDLPPETVKVIVKKLTIKDTDAGLLNSNVFEKKGYLSQISHMHPGTFERLQTFAEKWKHDPTVKDFFHRECTYSKSQVARAEKYLLAAASTLQSRKAAGKLHLDLDLDEYFQGAAPNPSPTPTPSPEPSPTPEPAPAHSEIVGSVGRWEKGSQNTSADVKTVQRLLGQAAKALQAPQLDPKGVDGKIARPPAKSGTVAAIKAFQNQAGRGVDGLIEPGKGTWKALLTAAGESAG